MNKIKILAQETLKKNLVSLGQHNYLAAGAHHFHTLWTRDFCFSVDGLITNGHIKTAQDHLELLFTHLRNDGLVPRVVDSLSTRVRVVLGCLLGIYRPLKEPLKPEYVDEHGTEASDSNALVILAADAVDRQAPGFWLRHEPELRKVWSLYEKSFSDGLWHQKKFSDWQDSTAREGISSYIHILLWKSAQICETRGLFAPPVSEKYAQTLYKDLFDRDKNLFISLKGRQQWNADSTLLALYWNFFPKDKATIVYDSLKNSHLWKNSPLGMPGIPTYPCYSNNEKSFAVRFVKTTGYHDSYYWTWLMGLAIKVALVHKDTLEANRIEQEVEKLHEQSVGIEEVFDSNGRPVKTWAYRSECPFSWGAAWLC